MSLSATDLTYIRQIIGDNDTDHDLTDAQIQAQWTRGAGTVDYSATDEAVPFVYLLRLRLGLAVNLTPNIDGDARNVKQQQIREWLDYWERKAGLSGALATYGTLDYAIDEDDPTS